VCGSSRSERSNPSSRYGPAGGIQVPYWEKIILIAASAFDMAGLGYLGVDVVIDREQGPPLLELNAQPGLDIQIAQYGWASLKA